MRDHIVEILAMTGGFVSALFLKIPIFAIETDIHRLFIALVGGILSGIAGWLIRLFLDRQKEKYEDKKRRDEWRDKMNQP